MKSIQLSTLNAVQKELRSGAFDVYLSAMNELFLHHEDFDFVRKLQGYFRSKAYDKALSFADSLSETAYSDATTHFVANQFAALVRKYPWDPKVVGTDPETAAIRTFFKSERKCFLLNKKFALYDSFRSPHEEKLMKMRNFIRYVIGEKPPIAAILDNASFGKGASIGIHGNATNLARKLLANKWTVSPGAAVYAYWALMRNPHTSVLLRECRDDISCLDPEVSKARFWSKVHTTQNNKISFVPKTAKTHRAIAVEPLLNGLVQKGADVFMRKCLKRVGIDLEFGQSTNREKACKGSSDDSQRSFVTIDLSSASDSISIGLARSLLPPDWFYFLDSIRSHRYELQNKSFSYQKFCSMGNGFCFPLETLIFAACCHASGCGEPDTDFSVYGDDIIVRKLHAGDVLSLLKTLGFSPNASKTFISGSFRESCGSDWFGGKDVRPYTLDYALDSLENMFKWLNLTRRNEKTSLFFGDTYHIILDRIPDRFKFWRPYKGSSDSGIDSFGSEHLTSSNCFFDRRKHLWRCRELRHTPISDRDMCKPANRHSSVDMYALLGGAKSLRYQVVFTLRRKTRTTIVLTDYSEATSMWLPETGLVSRSDRPYIR